MPREIIETVLSFGCPISFLRFRVVCKQGDVIYSCIPKAVKKTWTLMCQELAPNDLKDESWWLFAYGLILILQKNKDNIEWEAVECHMMQSLLCGLWRRWELSTYMNKILFKIFHGLEPPKRLLGKVILKIYCEMYVDLVISDKLDLLHYFFEKNPDFSTLDALIVSNADPETFCNGLYIARELQTTRDIRIYDLWSDLLVPSRSLIVYGNQKKFGCNARIVGNKTRGVSKISEIYKYLEHQGASWMRPISDMIHFHSHTQVEKVSLCNMKHKIEDLVLCYSLSSHTGENWFPQWQGVEEAL